MKKAILLAVAAFLACSAPSTVAPLTIPLQYKTQAKPLEFPALASCSALSAIEVVDTRSDKTIGKRYAEKKSSESVPVTASTDVAAWVRSGVEDALKRSGVAVGKSGAPVLHISVDQISTLENVLHRSGYEGRITLSVDLQSASGKSCWKDRPDGFAENYGYAGSVENYQETLNHALDRAMIRLLSEPEFKQAVCTTCG